MCLEAEYSCPVGNKYTDILSQTNKETRNCYDIGADHFSKAEEWLGVVFFACFLKLLVQEVILIALLNL